MMCGGAGQSRAADAEVQAVCDKIRQQLEEKVGKAFTEYVALLVSTQVVAGTNYFVKIHIGNEEYIHARIYKPLPGQGDISLHSHQANKTKEEAVGFFE